MISRRSVVLVSALLGLAACIPSRRNGRTGSEPWPPPNQNNGQYAQGYPQQYPTTAYPTAATAPPVTTPTGTAKRPPNFHLPTARPTATTPAPMPTAPTVTGCGEIAVDGVTIPLDCFSKTYAKVDGVSKALSRGTLRSATPAPEYVDHRYDKVEGPIRHQRSVGAGAAFALASAIDQATIRSNAASQPVSVMHLWARARTPSLGEVLKQSLGKGVTSETSMPFDEGIACAWTTDPVAKRLCKPRGASDPTAAELSKADNSAVTKLADVVEIDGTNIDELRETIAKNQDVLVALRVDPDAWKAVIKAAEAEPLLPDYIGGGAVHSVALSGYAKQDGRWYFLVKNSWGTSWGANGYAWIEEGTLKKNMVAAFVIQVASNTGGASTPATCPNGTVPDATTGQCAPPCPDHSPRNNGVCASSGASTCPPGFVNTTGVCVVAAPTQSGMDQTTGIAYICGAAGCTYTWPKGTLGCPGVACSISCPAPKFLAAVNVEKKTISCTE
ncbi:MAG: C1 family peptidase [Polyangiaceae bacterium]